MSASFIYAVLLLTLFTICYFMRRRFGILGLALAAGAIVSELWSTSATTYLQDMGMSVMTPSLTLLVAVLITILPAFLLLFAGPTYKKTLERIIGSLLFAVLGVVLIIPQIGGELVYDPIGLTVNSFVEANRSLIIAAGFFAAVVDILMASWPKHHKSRGKAE